MKSLSFAAPRQGITGAVFMIGLAILFATDWFWPGILVLIGVTSFLGAYVERSAPDDDDIPLRVERPDEEPPRPVRYASQCTSCGATTPQELQDGTATQQAAYCSFCGSPLGVAE